MQHAGQPLERHGIQQLSEQRMRRGDHPHLARQNRTKMLQSVATAVGVGKTHLAHALGHIACRRGRKVHAERADRLFKRLRAARLDHTHDIEMRRLIAVDLLIIDDFALQALDPTETTDFYELIVERHLKTATLVTSNRDPNEWLAALSDPLLAQSAIDRLQSSAWELIVEGESYRRRQKPTLTDRPTAPKEARR